MVIDRSDGIVNICEMKYSRLPYMLTKSAANKMELRESAFQTENPGKSWTQIVMITTKGLKPGLYNSAVQKELTLDNLFE